MVGNSVGPVASATVGVDLVPQPFTSNGRSFDTTNEKVRDAFDGEKVSFDQGGGSAGFTGPPKRRSRRIERMAGSAPRQGTTHCLNITKDRVEQALGNNSRLFIQFHKRNDTETNYVERLRLSDETATLKVPDGYADTTLEVRFPNTVHGNVTSTEVYEALSKLRMRTYAEEGSQVYTLHSGQVCHCSGYLNKRFACAWKGEKDKVCYGPITAACAVDYSNAICAGPVEQACAYNHSTAICTKSVGVVCASRYSYNTSCTGTVGSCAEESSSNVTCTGEVREVCTHSDAVNVTCTGSVRLKNSCEPLSRGNCTGGESVPFNESVDPCCSDTGVIVLIDLSGEPDKISASNTSVQEGDYVPVCTGETTGTGNETRCNKSTVVLLQEDVHEKRITTTTCEDSTTVEPAQEMTDYSGYRNRQGAGSNGSCCDVPHVYIQTGGFCILHAAKKLSNITAEW